MPLLGNTQAIIRQIDEFLDKVSEGGMLFKPAIESYLRGDTQDFEERIRQVEILEAQADKASRNAENQLYEKSLIPEYRGDVLGLLENTDTVIDTIKTTLKLFVQEHPVIREEFHNGFISLAEASANAADSTVLSARMFFRDVKSVQERLHKVIHYEREADRISDGLKRKIFDSDLDLAHKIHLRYFALNVERVSDAAEEVANRLNIYTIKRMI